jgi:Cys-tRNA(Pro)/Cys-tRNA(Cys) deacylase
MPQLPLTTAIEKSSSDRKLLETMPTNAPTARHPVGTPATRALEALAIPHRLFRHPGPVTSLEQAARERGQQPAQVVRSIVFRVAKDEFVMVLVAGAQQVSWPRLRRHLGQSRISLANEAELLSATGYVVGAVSPFGLLSPMPVLIDESVLAVDEISIGSGERGATVIMRSADLLRALGGMVGKFTGTDDT